MGDARAVADDIQSLVLGHQVFIERDLHVVELDLHAVKQGVVIRRTGRDLVKRVDHLDDVVENTLGQYQAQIARRRLQGRAYGALRDTVMVGASAAFQIAEALYDHAAAEHIAQHRDALTVAVAVLERLRKMLADQQRKVGILRLFGRILKAVAVDGDDTVGVLIDDDAVGVHAEGADVVLEFLGAVHDLALVQFIGQMGEDDRGQLHAHADIDAVGLGVDVELLTDLFHPL